MIDPTQFQKLMSILSLRQQTLQQIQEHFLTSFSDSYSVFNASYVISNLININLLTIHQRLVAIFLLIENFKSEGIKKHPFGATILNVSLKTSEPYERRMIADLIIENKRERYSKFKIETLLEQSQSLLDTFEERPQIKKLRDEFIVGLPKISQSLKSQVMNIIPDFNEKEKKYFSPEFEVNAGSIRGEELSNEGFNVGFMRPLPEFLEVSPTEYNWLSPGIVSDVHWDNTAEIEKKMVKVKGLIKKGLQTHLNKDEATEIERVLDQQTYTVLYLDVTPDNILSLIRNNPFVAVSFLVKMSNYPLVSEYLDAIIESQVSLNSIDVVTRLTKAAKVQNQFLQSYGLKIMKECQTIPENHKDRLKIPRVIAIFLRGLMKVKVLNLAKYEEEMEEFTNCFIEIQEVQALKKSYKT